VSKYTRVFIVGLVFLLAVVPAPAQKTGKSTQVVLWSDPGDIRAKDLLDGPGGKQGRPRPPFKFKKQLATGNSPKFDVTDAAGEEWRVKLGPEAHAEPVAARLLWAVGYFANENYFEDQIQVDDIIPLGRGDEFQKGNTVSQARLQRKLGKHEKSWSWGNNPFKDTREFNGLRVMMALLHNWDLKDENNARFHEKKSGREIYYVSDLGASFGTTGKSYTEAMSKSNLSAYRSENFISKVTPEYVDFNFPTHPALYHVFNLPYFAHSLHNHWLGKHIPREHVRWIASLLAQLSTSQIEDAFRAGGYSPEQVEAYTAVVRERIAQLSKL
jgi:hypothetical protein